MNPRTGAQQSLVQRLSRTLTAAVLAVWLLSIALVGWYVDSQIQDNFDVELIESAHRQLYPALLELQLTNRKTTWKLLCRWRRVMIRV